MPRQHSAERGNIRITIHCVVSVAPANLFQSFTSFMCFSWRAIDSKRVSREGFCVAFVGLEKENKLQFANRLGLVLISKYFEGVMNDRLARESR